MPEQVVPVGAVRRLEVRLCAIRIKCSYPHHDHPCKVLNSTNNDIAALRAAAVTGQYSKRIRVRVSNHSSSSEVIRGAAVQCKGGRAERARGLLIGGIALTFHIP